MSDRHEANRQGGLMNCPICDLPMVWSELHERTWCSIYGDHKEQHEPRPRSGFPLRYRRRCSDIIRLPETSVPGAASTAPAPTNTCDGGTDGI